jgi:hypothetical protein
VKEFRVEVRVKNNLLYRAIDAAGFDSVAAFSRHIGVNNTVVGAYMNLQLPPISARGWRPSAIKIANALKAMPEDLFPADYLRDAIKQHKVVREYSADEIEGVMKIAQETPEQLMIQSDALSTLDGAIGSLPERYQTVIRMRFGLDGHREHTLDEVATAFGVTRERIRQVEWKAIRMLRNPVRSLTREMMDAFV